MNIIKNKKILIPILLSILIICYIIYYLIGPYKEIKKQKQSELLQTKIHRFSELQKNRIKYFKDKKVALYYNFGLLAKLLGYSVLHTDEYDKELKVDIQEYLILDPRVITINSNR